MSKRKAKDFNPWQVYLLIVVFFLLGLFSSKLFNLPLPLTLTSLTSRTTSSALELSANQLKTMLADKKFTFINVHTPYAGEIEKTDKFIPYDQIVANSDSLPGDKNTPLVLYCQTGRMSKEAIATLQKLGYTNVKHLTGGMEAWKKEGLKTLNLANLPNEVLPENGVELPVSWKDLGPKLISFGVIDLAKFKKALRLTPEQEKILTDGSEEKIIINSKNSQFVVDLLWALGLAQKSIVYEEGPMGREYKKNAANFASTGGWNLASGDAMNYYNRYDIIPLTSQMQQRVAEISKNVYRPCCGNPTWFPDCNHGMAALAIIELLVAGGVDDQTIYKKLLGFNSFWFPDTYLTTATYLARQGLKWKDVDAKMVLGKDYSSARGAMEIAKKTGPLPYGQSAGSSCGS